ncbi:MULTISPECIES: cupin domain-containing protein [Amycolatopsis methanolica group]|uniref:(S)-ureidoglycine aminohydrolase cupin domain-containing protein n=1 Tax=Amycolatopsis methanolica 239 TaxID=1068978 RepID=A0A076N454_AMYME|nr:cupin domain-containing protein [Amycolatopsis methanolica]AIJ24742.1 hypothetical protein AMETH_4650 [Amycolatopsis methanolica 239]
MTQHLGNAFHYDLDAEGYESLEDSRTTIHTAAHHIGMVGGVNVGVWEAEPGLIGGLTADEIFVVLEGRAEVTFEDTKERIEIGPGDIVRLNAGQRNTWRTLERLRKVSVWSDSGAQQPSS